ncbi:MAG: 7-carboxy-7-deazaguanine synthase QueE [Sulfuricellaceae bacterium]
MIPAHGDLKLRVSEIFYSLQGETSRTGLPTVFVRLTGCPLRCGYCDTDYAFQGGETLSLAEILRRVGDYCPHYVTVTGGEPLAQKNCLPLLADLCDAGFSVSLETGGALDISGVDPRVSVILDIKTPGSGEVESNHWDNLELLKAGDELKFVLCDEADYRWARALLREKGLTERCPVLFSPVPGRLDPAALAEWILRDRLPVRFQMQLHKVLWSDARGK